MDMSNMIEDFSNHNSLNALIGSIWSNKEDEKKNKQKKNYDERENC